MPKEMRQMLVPSVEKEILSTEKKDCFSCITIVTIVTFLVISVTMVTQVTMK